MTRFTAASPIQAWQRSASSSAASRAASIGAAGCRHGAEVVQDLALEAGQGEPVGALDGQRQAPLDQAPRRS